MRSALAFAGSLLLFESSVPTPVPWQVLDDPVPVRVPAEVAVRWSDPVPGPALASLPCDGPSAIRVPWAVGSGARVDIFSRRNREWTWSATFRLAGETGCLPSTIHPPLGVLVRVASRPSTYGWAESVRTGRLDVPHYRNLRIGGFEANLPLYLYADGEESPRILAAGSSKPIRLLPVATLLLCVGGPAPGCGVVPEDASAFSRAPAAESPGSARIFRSPQRVVRVRALTEGRSLLIPREVPAQLLTAGKWSAVSLPEGTWNDAVVDWELEESARRRFEGRELPRPPDHVFIDPSPSYGLAVRPMVRVAQAVVEPEARLLILPPTEGVSGRIPLASLSGDSGGVFRAEDLPSGRYRLKLLSSVSTGTIQTADLTAGQVVDVSFDSGPMIQGRLRPPRMGDSRNPPEVQVIRKGVSPESAAGEEDLADALVAAPASSEGKFRFTVNRPGEYLLRGTWGKARGHRTFTVTVATKELDLGEIPLEDGITLGGILRNCPRGELSLYPLPPLDRPVELRFFDALKAKLDEEGRFLVEGVMEGVWLLSARCDSVRVPVEPPSIHVQSRGATFVELFANRPSSDAPP